jgi:hypothetical protein
MSFSDLPLELLRPIIANAVLCGRRYKAIVIDDTHTWDNPDIVRMAQVNSTFWKQLKPKILC